MNQKKTLVLFCCLMQMVSVVASENKNVTNTVRGVSKLARIIASHGGSEPRRGLRRKSTGPTSPTQIELQEVPSETCDHDWEKGKCPICGVQKAHAS